jgi:hypothetical protein
VLDSGEGWPLLLNLAGVWGKAPEAVAGLFAFSTLGLVMLACLVVHTIIII